VLCLRAGEGSIEFAASSVYGTWLRVIGVSHPIRVLPLHKNAGFVAGDGFGEGGWGRMVQCRGGGEMRFDGRWRFVCDQDHGGGAVTDMVLLDAHGC